jgi:hypothetical protein
MAEINRRMIDDADDTHPRPEQPRRRADRVFLMEGRRRRRPCTGTFNECPDCGTRYCPHCRGCDICPECQGYIETIDER